MCVCVSECECVCIKCVYNEMFVGSCLLTNAFFFFLAGYS